MNIQSCISSPSTKVAAAVGGLALVPLITGVVLAILQNPTLQNGILMVTGGTVACAALLYLALRTCQGKQRTVSPSIQKVRDKAPQKTSSELHFTWEDVLVLLKNQFGLRHVDSMDSAQREQRDGFTGDALNLDLLSKDTWKVIYPDDQADGKGYTQRDKLRLWPDRASSDLQKRVVEFLEQGVDAFIQSIGGEESAFLLVNYDAGGISAYDCDRYGSGLGKVGKQDVEGSQVLAVFPGKSARSALIRAIREIPQT